MEEIQFIDDIIYTSEVEESDPDNFAAGQKSVMDEDDQKLTELLKEFGLEDVGKYLKNEAVAVSDERDADTEDENDYEAKDNYEGLNGTTRTITLQTLMNANILQPGKSLMTIDYLGQKFVGDLMADGRIKSQETETLFLTPSAWAMYCKRIINPEKKSGCGWASVKYKGKKLDAYKNTWLRKCALQRDVNMDDLDLGEMYIHYGVTNVETIVGKKKVYRIIATVNN